MSAFPSHRMPPGLEASVALSRTLSAAGSDAALLLVDLDGVAAVNLQDGFTAGDELLALTADALEGAVRGLALGAAGTAVVRLACDEFAVVLDGVAVDLMLDVATTLTRAAGDASGLGACGGIAPIITSAEGSTDVRRTVRAAGLALRAALRAGSGSVRGPSAHEGTLTTVEEEDLEVRTLLRSGGFELHFQPLVDPMSARPFGVEALVRARSTAGTVSGPGGFLPQVRRSGLSTQLGTAIIADALSRWNGLLRQALRTHPEGKGPADVVLSVNVDAEQVEQDGFDGLVLHLLERSDVPAEELVLEVTEAVLGGAAARTRLQRLRDAGVRVAIDDFGAGPVVLSEIRGLPVDILKVDQVLVGRLDSEKPDVGLIEDLQRLAALLGLQLAVEAVETPALAARIAELGVPIAQGYHYARPMPPEELAARLLVANAVTPSGVVGGVVPGEVLLGEVLPGAATPGGAGER